MSQKEYGGDARSGKKVYVDVSDIDLSEGYSRQDRIPRSAFCTNSSIFAPISFSSYGFCVLFLLLAYSSLSLHDTISRTDTDCDGCVNILLRLSMCLLGQRANME